MSNGTRFRLISNTCAFRVVSTYLAAGRIPCVVGISLCGHYRTQARVADILCLL
jgi:hypothetical protein